MLPQSHIGYTLLTFKVAQKWLPSARRADYRLLALAAITPDLLDKPVVLLTYERWAATKLLAHTGLWHLLVLLLVGWRRPGCWPYALALSGHLLFDRLWHHPHTLYWPGRGRHFQRSHRPGRRRSSVRAYWHALRGEPRAFYLEIGGILALLLFGGSAALFRRARLRRFLATGRI